MTLAALIKEVELLDIRTTGMFARLGAGPPPEFGKPMDVSFQLKTGALRQGSNVFAVSFELDCRPKRTKGEREFCRFIYRATAMYRAQTHFADEVVTEFAQGNALVHLWPYARNYIQLASAQLGLLPILLPPFRVAHTDAPPNNK